MSTVALTANTITASTITAESDLYVTGTIHGNATSATTATTANTANSATTATTATTANSANFLNRQPDGDRNAATKLPTSSPNGIRFDFVQAGTTGTGGNYSGVMTIAPWTGTAASTGDASYQLAFGSTAVNNTGVPQLRIRNGIDSSWNGWKNIITEDNIASYVASYVGSYLPLSGGNIYTSAASAAAGPVLRVSKGASPLGNIQYDTMVLESNDVATLRIGESDGTTATITSGDAYTTISSTHPIRFFTTGTSTANGYSGMGGTQRMIIDNSGNTSFSGSVNVTTGSNNSGISLGGKTALSSTDGWLRLNQNSEFSGGVYTPGALQVGGTVWANGDILVGSSDGYGEGLVGTYSATRYQNVFAMGASYRLSADGTSAGSLYGIAWTHSNIGGQSIAGLEHQALFMMNGVTQSAVGNGIWTRGNLTAGGGTLTMSNSSSNSINFNTAGVSTPGGTGNKLNLYGTSYAIGIESSNMWFNSGGGFKWYTGTASTTAPMRLDSNGGLIVEAYNATYGVHSIGRIYGLSGQGEYGVIGGGSIYGVYGSGDTYGVYGTGQYGVYGVGTTFGVYGASSGSGQTAIFGGSSGSYSIGINGSGTLYDFRATGTGTNYGSFTGAHDVVLASDFPSGAEPGMILSVTGENVIRRDDSGNITVSTTIPTVRLADTANDPRVFGALVQTLDTNVNDDWYKAKPGERFGVANALGDGRVWVTDINGEIEAGDYITTSLVAGYGMKQTDDLVHNYTLGKATEDVDWDRVEKKIIWGGQGFKAYLIGVVYTSG